MVDDRLFRILYKCLKRSLVTEKAFCKGSPVNRLQVPAQLFSLNLAVRAGLAPTGSKTVGRAGKGKIRTGKGKEGRMKGRPQS